MNNTEIKQRINASLDQLNIQELTLIENLLNKIISSNNSNDPLAELRNSDFIGCFSAESNFAENSEKIAQEILSRKKNS